MELKGVRKSFYGVEVLHGVDFKLEPGTVHALMGENGAGKSTMMKIIAGIHLNDGGQVFIDGNEVTIDSPAKAQELGVAMIHQELSPVLEMSVAENIFLGREPSRSGFVDYRQLYKQTQELLDELKIPINPKVKMKSLRVADQQMVEIAKAISQNAHILIMDEPTSSITDREVESLFAMGIMPPSSRRRPRRGRARCASPCSCAAGARGRRRRRRSRQSPWSARRAAGRPASRCRHW